MSLQRQLEQKLNNFIPDHLEVLNESSEHSGPASESHFKITIVSSDFINQSLIKRTRSIHALCKEEIDIIHAFSVFAYTPDEWSRKTNSPISPRCGG